MGNTGNITSAGWVVVIETLEALGGEPVTSLGLGSFVERFEHELVGARAQRAKSHSRGQAATLWCHPVGVRVLELAGPVWERRIQAGHLYLVESTTSDRRLLTWFLEHLGLDPLSDQPRAGGAA